MLTGTDSCDADVDDDHFGDIGVIMKRRLSWSLIVSVNYLNILGHDLCADRQIAYICTCTSVRIRIYTKPANTM